jgi:hypothetical protein
MRRPWPWLLLLAACDPPVPPADAPVLPDPLVFEAPPDPAEETACTGVPAAGVTRAKHVTCDAELAHGPLAMGRLGDVLVENAHVRFLIREGDVSATTLGGFGGAVIDAERQGGIDRLKEIFPLFDLATARATDIAVVDADEARVRVLFEADELGLLAAALGSGGGRAGPFRGQIDYVLGPDDRALRIEVRSTTTVGVAGNRFLPGVALLIGGGAELVQPGYGEIDEDRPGGSGLPAIVAEARDEALAAGLEDEAGPLGSGTVLSVGTIVLLRAERPLVVSQGSAPSFALRLSPAALAADAWSAVSPAPASITMHTAPDSRVELARADGTVLARSRVGADGTARFALPAGEHVARAAILDLVGGLIAGRGTAAPFGAPVPIAGADVTLPAPPRGTLAVDATVEGASAPVRVTVMAGAEEHGRFVASGPTTRALPPGSYHVIVSHGLEHDVLEADVVIALGATETLTGDLGRAIDTAGLVAADFHLHSELSTDSRHRVEDALARIAAEGLDLVASTDHDFVTDYPALAASLGLELLAIMGDEVSSTSYGHLGAYPLRRDPSLVGAGAVDWTSASLFEAIAGIRAAGDATLGGSIVQINHPRLRGSGVFDVLALDAEGHAAADPTALDLPAGTDLDGFDADVIEVWNGYTRGDNEASFQDWLALTARGRRLTMVGNSDSHRPDLPAGSPRTFLRVADDAAFDWAEAAASLRAGEATIAGGILVTASLVGVAADVAQVAVRIQAPPWADCARLRIYAGAAVAIDRPVAASTAAIRLDETIDVPLAGATFVVVRADGERAPEPIQHFAPFGITNALRVP